MGDRDFHLICYMWDVRGKWNIREFLITRGVFPIYFREIKKPVFETAAKAGYVIIIKKCEENHSQRPVVHKAGCIMESIEEWFKKPLLPGFCPEKFWFNWSGVWCVSEFFKASQGILLCRQVWDPPP